MPCEYGVVYILPSIRAYLVQEMMRMGIPQNRVAEMLGITPASVSQYASKKRGCRIELGEGVKTEIQLLAQEISQGAVSDVVNRMCTICAMVRSSEYLQMLQECTGECIDDFGKLEGPEV